MPLQNRKAFLKSHFSERKDAEDKLLQDSSAPFATVAALSLLETLILNRAQKDLDEKVFDLLYSESEAGNREIFRKMRDREQKISIPGLLLSQSSLYGTPGYSDFLEKYNSREINLDFLAEGNSFEALQLKLSFEFFPKQKKEIEAIKAQIKKMVEQMVPGKSPARN